MVNIEAITRALLVADAGEGAVERITQPVEKNKNVDEPEGVGVLWCEGVGDAGEDLGKECEHGEVVGMDGGWGVVGEPDQEAFFVRSGDGGVDALGVCEGLRLYHAAMMADFGAHWQWIEAGTGSIGP